jgi:hypothetical protein
MAERASFRVILSDLEFQEFKAPPLSAVSFDRWHVHSPSIRFLSTIV